MNDVIKSLLERKSCKSYKKEQIPDEHLEIILKAGLAAPSGRNLHSSIIVAVQKPDDIRKMAEINAAVLGFNGDPFYGAPTVVVVFGIKSGATPFEDGCLAMGNMLNAAYSLGLGACWIHRARETFDTNEGKKLIRKWGIKGEVFGIGNCIIGYPSEDFHPMREQDESKVIRIK